MLQGEFTGLRRRASTNPDSLQARSPLLLPIVAPFIIPFRFLGVNPGNRSDVCARAAERVLLPGERSFAMPQTLTTPTGWTIDRNSAIHGRGLEGYDGRTPASGPPAFSTRKQGEIFGFSGGCVGQRAAPRHRVKESLW